MEYCAKASIYKFEFIPKENGQYAYVGDHRKCS